MLTEFQKRKLRRYFQFYDADRNGYIEREDYMLFAKRLARARGWAESTVGYEMIMARFMADWDLLRSFADANSDDRITEDEWFEYHNYIYFIDNKYRAGENDILGTIFEMLDHNNDGTISEDEFRTFYSIFGMDLALASQTFHKLNENGDGVLTRNEIAKLYRQFAHSDDPTVMGNWLFGPF
jgi:Ca2+-binding EF-hand superfamily protein